MKAEMALCLLFWGPCWRGLVYCPTLNIDETKKSFPERFDSGFAESRVFYIELCKMMRVRAGGRLLTCGCTAAWTYATVRRCC